MIFEIDPPPLNEGDARWLAERLGTKIQKLSFWGKLGFYVASFNPAQGSV